MVRFWLGKKVSKTSSEPISQAWFFKTVIPAILEALGRKIMV
jgi:hypothetical protein